MANGDTANAELDFDLVNQMIRSNMALQNKLDMVSGKLVSFSDGVDKLGKILPDIKDRISSAKSKDGDVSGKKSTFMDKYTAGSPLLKAIGGMKTFMDKNVKGGDKEKTFEDKTEDMPVVIRGFSPAALTSLATLLGGITAVADKSGASGGGGIGGMLKGLLGGATGGVKGLMSGLMGSMKSAGIGGKLATLATNPVTLLLAGIIWGVVDAFRGAKMAEQWGVSKTAGAMGGLLGGMDKGFKGAMKNMGKWALIGAGIGSVVPVVGTLLGGLIGGVIGAILGWIGGERIAKAFQAVGDWFKKMWGKAVDGVKAGFGTLVDLFNSPIKTLNRLWTGLQEKFKAVKEKITGFLGKFAIGKLILQLIEPLLKIRDKISSFAGDLKDKLFAKVIELKDKIFGIFENINFGDIINNIKDGFMSIVGKIKDILGGLLKKLNPLNWFKKKEDESADTDIDENVKNAISKASENSSEKIVSAISGFDSNLSGLLQAGFKMLQQMHEETIESITTALKSQPAMAGGASRGSGGGGGVSPARGQSAHDSAYELRSRYWTSYTRGM